MRLAGTTVLLTAGAGRCESLALMLSRQGARLLAQDEDEDCATKVARAVRAQGGACEVVPGALETVALIETAVENLWRQFAPVRGAVLAPQPGGTASKFVETTPDRWHGSLAAGLAQPFFLIRALASRMGEGEGGTIVSIVPGVSTQLDSVVRVVGDGLVTMTRGVAKVLPERVRIAAVCGGSVDTRAATVAFLLAEPLASGTIVELES